MVREIAIDALAIGNPPQGIGAYGLNLVRALAESPGELEYTVFLPEYGLEHFRGFEGPAVRLESCPVPAGRWGRIFYQHLAFRRKLKKERVFLLHSVGNLLPMGYRGRAVLTVHDIDFAVHPGSSPVMRRLLFDSLTPASLKKADVVVTDSKYSAESIRRLYPSINHEKIRIVPLGAPTIGPISEETRSFVSNRYGLSAHGYFLSVGTLELRKNIRFIIRAFETYRRETGHQARLVMVGQPGYGFGEITRLISESPYSKDIIMPGYMPLDQLHALYAGAAALLFLSEAEGFGLPALEAMASGCPVIASRAGALPETCGDAAIFISPGNVREASEAMERLSGGYEERTLLIEKGRKNLGRFSWAEHARDIKKLYRDLS